MASSLTFTNGCFMESKGITSSTPINTKFTILTSSVSDRRLYGFAVLSSDNAIQTIKIHLNDGTNSIQIFTLAIPASSGTNGVVRAVDVFGNTLGDSVFQKMREPNGLAYFNIPAGWSIEMQYNTTLVSETITTHLFGEIY
jgi:hypothetical protein